MMAGHEDDDDDDDGGGREASSALNTTFFFTSPPDLNDDTAPEIVQHRYTPTHNVPVGILYTPKRKKTSPYYNHAE